MAYTYRCNSRRTKPSRHYYYEPPPPPSCAGIGKDGQTCGELVSGGGFCFAHKGQGYWDVLNHPPLEERRAHAAMGCCNGIAASTGRLCNRKIGGITFCHLHRDQQPPLKFYEDVYDYFSTPRRGLELTRRSDIVKENMMVFCRIRKEWYEGDRLFRKKAQEAAEKKKAKAAEEAARAHERYWEKEAQDRKERAEAEAKKAKEEAEKKQKEYERQKAAEEERQRKFESQREERRRKEEKKQKEAEEAAKAKRMKETKDMQEIVNQYRRSCAEFDKIARFSSSTRASFASIPWPVLLPQNSLTADEITWVSVERFSQFSKDYLGAAEHKALLDQARKRYHPDRWAAKNVLASVLDEGERQRVQHVGKVVSQAINSLVSSSS